MKIKIRGKIPGVKSSKVLKGLERKNGGWGIPYPLVFSGKGKGAYCEDIDGNVFLDFGSQIASNPLGYNHSDLLKVVKKYSNRFPVKYAGQDFSVEEHLKLIEELTSISPKGMNAAFIVNSGAEAVENAMKITMRRRELTKYVVSMKNAFHGRTLGALSLTNSKKIQTHGFLHLPFLRVPYTIEGGEVLENYIKKYGAAKLGFVYMECFQGEGGYNIAPEKLVRDVRSITRKHGIPMIYDEVQSGMGRTGKWWAYENFGVTPDVFSSAKALQVGAIVANKNLFPQESGAISSTWGGGPLLDMALGAKTIQVIKKEKLLSSNRKLGKYLVKGMNSIQGASNARGIGLMTAFDLDNARLREDVVIECAKRGLIVLGAGKQSIRLIPPYVIEKKDIDNAIEIIDAAVKSCSKKGFKHSGHVCNFLDCGYDLS